MVTCGNAKKLCNLRDYAKTAPEYCQVTIVQRLVERLSVMWVNTKMPDTYCIAAARHLLRSLRRPEEGKAEQHRELVGDGYTWRINGQISLVPDASTSIIPGSRV